MLQLFGLLQEVTHFILHETDTLMNAILLVTKWHRHMGKDELDAHFTPYTQIRSR